MSLKQTDEIDIFFMKKALLQARKAFDNDEVPVGAVVVGTDGKTVLGQGYNLTEKSKCQSGHAEIRAIQKACKKIGNWRLNGCTIYVTLEPCSMCMNLILLSKIGALVFGARSNLFGFRLDKYASFELYKCPMLIREKICEQESLNLLKLFFKNKRKK